MSIAMKAAIAAVLLTASFGAATAHTGPGSVASATARRDAPAVKIAGLFIRSYVKTRTNRWLPPSPCRNGRCYR